MGSVARISNDLFKATRTRPLELNYFNPQFRILPGMYCQVHWPVRRRQYSLFVPISAVVTNPLDSFVCKIEKGTVHWVSVMKGEIMGDTVEVFGDLREGDTVAKHASEELQNGSLVQAVPSKSNVKSEPTS